MSDGIRPAGSRSEDRDEEEAEVARSHRGLLAVVIVLGILLVVGFAVVVATIASRLSGGDEKAAAAVQPAGPVSLDMNAAGAFEVPVPQGYRIANVTGDERRLVIHLESAAGPARILIIDGRNGKLVSSLIINHSVDAER